MVPTLGSRGAWRVVRGCKGREVVMIMSDSSGSGNGVERVGVVFFSSLAYTYISHP
jgi:hypothetical protein